MKQTGVSSEREQPLLVAHDQREGALLGFALVRVAALGVDRLLAAVLALLGCEVRVAHLFGTQARERGIVGLQPLELLVEEPADQAVGGRVVGHPVDEEEREHLDAAVSRSDCTSMCCLIVWRICSRKMTGREGAMPCVQVEPLAVAELDEAVCPRRCSPRTKPPPRCFGPARLVGKIVALAQRHLRLARAARSVTRVRTIAVIFGGGVISNEGQELRVRVVALGDPVDLDALDQVALVRVERAEAVDRGSGWNGAWRCSAGRRAA